MPPITKLSSWQNSTSLSPLIFTNIILPHSTFPPSVVLSDLTFQSPSSIRMSSCSSPILLRKSCSMLLERSVYYYSKTVKQCTSNVIIYVLSTFYGNRWLVIRTRFRKYRGHHLVVVSTCMGHNYAYMQCTLHQRNLRRQKRRTAIKKPK